MVRLEPGTRGVGQVKCTCSSVALMHRVVGIVQFGTREADVVTVRYDKLLRKAPRISATTLPQSRPARVSIREEMRIKDSRITRIPPYRRPFYPPTEPMSILEVRPRTAGRWSRGPRLPRHCGNDQRRLRPPSRRPGSGRGLPAESLRRVVLPMGLPQCRPRDGRAHVPLATTVGRPRAAAGTARRGVGALRQRAAGDAAARCSARDSDRVDERKTRAVGVALARAHSIGQADVVGWRSV